jgi:hypothetical protein
VVQRGDASCCDPDKYPPISPTRSWHLDQLQPSVPGERLRAHRSHHDSPFLPFGTADVPHPGALATIDQRTLALGSLRNVTSNTIRSFGQVRTTGELLMGFRRPPMPAGFMKCTCSMYTHVIPLVFAGAGRQFCAGGSAEREKRFWRPHTRKGMNDVGASDAA